MAWAVFKDTMRYTWKMTLLWGIGFASMMILTLQLSPALNGLQLVDLFASLPPWMMAAAGVTDVNVLASVEGLIAVGVFGKLALMFAAYPVVMGLRVTSAEEDNGTMDVMLSLPLPRWRVIFEKFLAYTLNIIILMILTVSGLYIGQFGVNIDIDINKLIVVTLSVIPVMIFLLALTTFTGAVISRRQQVLTIITGYIIFSFVIQSLGPLVDSTWMNAIESFALFTYYNVESTLLNGVTMWHVALMLGLALLLIGGSFINFERRDIAV
ncbi:MAG: ABC transporter permease subunit [Phototrophicaceae bacterium]